MSLVANAAMHVPLPEGIADKQSGDAFSVAAEPGLFPIPVAGPLATTAPWNTVGKPLLDRCLAAILLVLLAPLTFLAALLVKLTTRGPAFYTQTRVGENGRLFTILKLRTMYHDCEAATGSVWSQAGDPRITVVGRVLRATHIDEFPQLLNVLCGHMSLIGPRPERPEIVTVLQSKVAGYTGRLAVRPGISGLAQVQLPADVDLDGVRKKLVCDLHYINNLGAWMDVRIMLCTALFLMGIPLRFSRRFLAIPELHPAE